MSYSCERLVLKALNAYPLGYTDAVMTSYWCNLTLIWHQNYDAEKCDRKTYSLNDSLTDHGLIVPEMLWQLKSFPLIVFIYRDSNLLCKKLWSKKLRNRIFSVSLLWDSSKYLWRSFYQLWMKTPLSLSPLTFYYYPWYVDKTQEKYFMTWLAPSCCVTRADRRGAAPGWRAVSQPARQMSAERINDKLILGVVWYWLFEFAQNWD